MTEEESRKIEIIYRLTKDSKIEDRFFTDPYEALDLFANLLITDAIIEFIAFPCMRCIDFNSKEMYYT